VTVHTGRAGMAAKAGHDLNIDVGQWSGTLDGSGLKATLDVASLAVRDGTGGIKPLTDKDKADIKKTLDEKILKTAQNPQITFESGPIADPASTSWRLDGRLTLVGVTNPIQIPVTVEAGNEETKLTASVQVVQSQFRIKPYSGMMGALKVADPVEIRAEVRIPAADWPF
jgi:polyisoprenoid-binding protein YceI